MKPVDCLRFRGRWAVDSESWMGNDMSIPLDEISNIVGLQLGVRRVKATDHILQDLAAESIDVLNIVATIEERYGVVIDETALAEVGTVAELHGLVNEEK